MIQIERKDESVRIVWSGNHPTGLVGVKTEVDGVVQEDGNIGSQRELFLSVPQARELMDALISKVI